MPNGKEFDIGKAIGEIQGSVKNIETNQARFFEALEEHESRISVIEGQDKGKSEIVKNVFQILGLCTVLVGIIIPLILNAFK